MSFVLAAITCGLAALCYAEFASTVPVAGSAYTFSYATFGEFDRLDHRLGPDPGVRRRRRPWWPRAGRRTSARCSDSPVAPSSSERFTVDWGALLIIAIVTHPVGDRHEAVVQRQRRDHRRSRSPWCCWSSSSARSTSRPPTTRRSSRRPSPAAAGSGIEQSLFSLVTGAGGSHYGWYGVLAGRVDRVLRVHRFRRRRHDRGGDEEAAARCAARHPRHAGDRHRPLRRGGGRAVGHGALHRAEEGRRGRQPGDRVRRQRRRRGRPRSSRSARWPV